MELDDLSPEDWAQAVQALHAADAAVNDETVLVRSHLWPQANGSYDWIVLVPGTEHRAEGNSPSISESYHAIDVMLTSWYPEASDPAKRMTVGRMIPEVEVRRRS